MADEASGRVSSPLGVAQTGSFALFASQAVWQVWAKLGPAAGILYGTVLVVTGGNFLVFSFTGYLEGCDALAFVAVGVFCAGFLISATIFGRTSQSLATAVALSAMETLSLFVICWPVLVRIRNRTRMRDGHPGGFGD